MLHTYYGIPKDAKMNELMDRFPILFQNRTKSMRETCMCWGIECPIGWYHIIEQLCTVLEFYNMEFTENHGIAIIADQVKEKFGTLRFYYSVLDVDKDGAVLAYAGEGEKRISDDENRRRVAKDYLEMLADKIISEAEDMTYNTCARCGTPLDKDNRVETKGWITYLCKDCDGKPFDQSDDEDEPSEAAPCESEEKKEVPQVECPKNETTEG